MLYLKNYSSQDFFETYKELFFLALKKPIILDLSSYKDFKLKRTKLVHDIEVFKYSIRKNKISNPYYNSILNAIDNVRFITKGKKVVLFKREKSYVERKVNKRISSVPSMSISTKYENFYGKS